MLERNTEPRYTTSVITLPIRLTTGTEPSHLAPPWRRLALAVLLQALKDAQGEDDAALEWIEKSAGFVFWCGFLEVDPSRARRRFLEEAKNPKYRRRLTPAVRREILAELWAKPSRSNRAIGRDLGVDYDTVRKIRMIVT